MNCTGRNISTVAKWETDEVYHKLIGNASHGTQASIFPLSQHYEVGGEKGMNKCVCAFVCKENDERPLPFPLTFGVIRFRAWIAGQEREGSNTLALLKSLCTNMHFSGSGYFAAETL